MRFDFHQFIAFVNLAADFAVAAMLGISLALVWVSRTLGQKYITNEYSTKRKHNG
jgi:hypothetical protein